MKTDTYKIFPLGLDALTIEFGDRISIELNETALKLYHYFAENRFAGLIEMVPAYASVTFFYDVLRVKKNFPRHGTAFEAVKKLLEKALKNLPDLPLSEQRLIRIPVCFAPEFALDLEFIATSHNLAPGQVIEIFLSRTYRVYMLGFLPGFAYLGEVDARIATPRKPAPRLRVPKGSVGIAGLQTGIYPLDSPGGWQIIGQARTELFSPAAARPCLLQPGDLVKFYSSDK